MCIFQVQIINKQIGRDQSPIKGIQVGRKSTLLTLTTFCMCLFNLRVDMAGFAVNLRLVKEVEYYTKQNVCKYENCTQYCIIIIEELISQTHSVPCHYFQKLYLIGSFLYCLMLDVSVIFSPLAPSIHKSICESHQGRHT